MRDISFAGPISVKVSAYADYITVIVSRYLDTVAVKKVVQARALSGANLVGSTGQGRRPVG